MPLLVRWSAIGFLRLGWPRQQKQILVLQAPDRRGLLFRFVLVAALASGVSTILCIAFLQQTKTQLNGCGWLNLAAISALIAWYFVDIVFPRRHIYWMFGFEEAVLRQLLRLWRRLILLALVLVALAWAGVVIEQRAIAEAASSAAPTFGAVIWAFGVFFAALGWLYSNFEREKAARAAHTLDAVRDQLYSKDAQARIRNVEALALAVRKRDGITAQDQYPVTSMTIRLCDLPESERPDGPLSLTLGDALLPVLQSFDQIGYGIRQGQFDITTFTMLWRQRFVRYAFIFGPHLIDDTDAKPKTNGTGLIAHNKNWEHFLWLVAKMPLYESDNVDIKKMIQPPPPLVGTIPIQKTDNDQVEENSDPPSAPVDNST